MDNPDPTRPIQKPGNSDPTRNLLNPTGRQPVVRNQVDTTRMGGTQNLRNDSQAFSMGGAVPTAQAVPEAEPVVAVKGYEIIQELGRGGMGVVYKARHVALNRMVALKMVLGSEFANAEQLLRFRIEGEMLARLQHPNIVQIYEVAAHDGKPYFALEYVEGGSLLEKLGKQPLGFRDAAQLVESLARAVHAAHIKGVVHRDLKPANILLSPKQPGMAENPYGFDPNQWIPKITDFGLAKPLDADSGLTQTGYIMGTPEYMAPEQVRCQNDEIGPATDVYSLGNMMYRMLTARVPFDSTSTMDLLQKVAEADPVPPTRHRATIPRDLESICLKCLEKNPARRYRSAEALADDLRRFLNGEPIEARPITPVERLWKASRRRPVIAAVVAMAAAVVVLGFPLVTSLWLNASSARSDAEDARDRARKLQKQADGRRRDAEKARDQASKAKTQAEKATRDAKAAKAKVEQALKQADASIYFSRVAQTRLEWRLNHLAGARGLLNRSLASKNAPRGWEWYYLNGVIHPGLMHIPSAHLAFVNRIALSPDGKRFASVGGTPFGGNKSGRALIVDAVTGQGLHAFPYLKAMPNDVAWSPNGKQVAVAAGLNVAKVYDSTTGQVVRQIKQAGVIFLAFHPKHPHLATVTRKGRFTIWNTANGNELWSVVLKGNAGGRVAFNADGRWLGVANNQGIHVFDYAAQKEVSLIDHRTGDFAFSPDGKRVVSAGNVGYLWDVASGKNLKTLNGHESKLQAVAFCPDGKWVATAGVDRTVRIWDANTGREEMVLRGHEGRVSSVRFHPNGRYLISGGQQPADIILWDLNRTPEYTLAGPRRGAKGLCFSADSRNVVTAASGKVMVYDAATGLLRLTRAVDMVKKWLVPSNVAEFSGDARRLATVLEDQRLVKITEIETGREITLMGHKGLVMHLDFSRDGRRVASSAVYEQGKRLFREIFVWDAGTGQKVAEHSATAVNAFSGDVALSPDGSKLAFDDYDVGQLPNGLPAATAHIRVCDADNGRAIANVGLGLDLASCITFSPDGRVLASGTQNGKLFFYDLQNRKPITDQPRSMYGLAHLAFSPDSNRLAGVNREQVKVWDVQSGEEVMVVRGARRRSGDGGFNPKVAWSPDGKRLANYNWNKTITVWDAVEDVSPAGKIAGRQVAEIRTYLWHVRQAASLRTRPDDPALAFHLSYIKADPPFDPALVLERGRLFAGMDRWKEAASDYSTAWPHLRSADPELWYQYLLLKRRQGMDGRVLTQIYAEAINKFGQAITTEHDLYWLVRLSSVTPLPAKESSLTLPLADQYLKRNPKSYWASYISGIASYRSGKFKEAITHCQTALNRKNNRIAGLNYLVLALANHRLNQAAEAKKWRDQATKWMEEEKARRQTSSGIGWNDWLECLLLKQEADQVIK